MQEHIILFLILEGMHGIQKENCVHRTDKTKQNTDLLSPKTSSEFTYPNCKVGFVLTKAYKRKPSIRRNLYDKSTPYS